MKPLSLGVLVFLVACFLGSVRAQTHEKQDEIPIERCDRLPVVTMKVADFAQQVVPHFIRPIHRTLGSFEQRLECVILDRGNAN